MRRLCASAFELAGNLAAKIQAIRPAVLALTIQVPHVAPVELSDMTILIALDARCT